MKNKLNFLFLNNLYFLIQYSQVTYISKTRGWYNNDQGLLFLCILFILEPSPPRNLTLEDNGIDNIYVSYDTPEDKNGHITHQRIKYTYKPYNVCTTDQAEADYISKYKTIPINMSDKKFRFSLDELEPFWEYIISVQVNTSAGFSNFSDTLTIRTRASSKYISCNKMQSTCFFIP